MVRINHTSLICPKDIWRNPHGSIIVYMELMMMLVSWHIRENKESGIVGTMPGVRGKIKEHYYYSLEILMGSHLL